MKTSPAKRLIEEMSSFHRRPKKQRKRNNSRLPKDNLPPMVSQSKEDTIKKRDHLWMEAPLIKKNLALPKLASTATCIPEPLIKGKEENHGSGEG